MSEADIHVALKKVIVDAALPYPQLFPNEDDSVPPTKPYIVVENVRIGRINRTMASQDRQSQGRLICTVVSQLGVGTRAADELAEDIANLFPEFTRINAGDNNITITQPPTIEEGRRDGSDWRTRVITDYLTE